MSKSRVLVVGLIAAGLIAHGGSSKAAGPYIPFHGVYWLTSQPSGLPAYSYVNETAGRVNLTVIGPSELGDAGLMQRFVNNGVWFILHFSSGEKYTTPPPSGQADPGAWDYLENKNGKFVTDLTAAKASMIASGSIQRLAGISLDEEWYGFLNGYQPVPGGPFVYPYNSASRYPSLAPYAANRVAQGDALRNLLALRIADINAAFPNAQYPNVYTVQVEVAWNDLLAYGAGWYYPPPASLDVLGIDPYFTGNVLGCDSTTKAAWDAQSGLLVQHALARFPQPMMLVAQAFRHTPGYGWPIAPAPCQMEWWYQLAMANAARIPALMWFSYGYTDTSVAQGVRHPDHVDRWLKLIEIFDRNLANKP